MTLLEPPSQLHHVPPEAPPLPALSTMWAVQPRFERDLGAFMGRAAELGYRAVEINHSMTAEQAGAILGYAALPGAGLPVSGVHAPAPLERHPSAGWNRELNLAALDSDAFRTILHSLPGYTAPQAPRIAGVRELLG